jgi:hypothetical protein
LHDLNDEPDAKPPSFFDFEFENYDLDQKILKDLVLDEIILYHNKNARKYYMQLKKKYPQGVLEMLYER